MPKCINLTATNLQNKTKRNLLVIPLVAATVCLFWATKKTLKTRLWSFEIVNWFCCSLDTQMASVKIRFFAYHRHRALKNSRFIDDDIFLFVNKKLKTSLQQ